MEIHFTKTSFFTKLVIVLLFIIQFKTSAQEAMDYDFSITQSASLLEMTDGTIELIGANKSATASAVTPIGFEVWFMGKRYTNFSVNCNGVLRFGTTAIHPEGNTYNIPNNARISAFSCLDQAPNLGHWKTSSNGKVHYKIIGTAPQRRLIIEWKNLHVNLESNLENALFQIVIHETAPQTSQPQGGQIELIYGKMSVFKSFANIRIGIGGGNGNSEEMGIDLATNPPTNRTGDVSTALDSGDVPFLNSSTDGSRTKFVLLSPIPDVQAQNLRTICNNTTGIQLDWDLDNSGGNIVGSVLYKSTDGNQYSFMYQTKNIQEISFIDTDVNLENTYWYRVYTVTEGQLSELQTTGELKVAPNELPEFDLGQFAICDGDSVTLDAGNYASFSWKNEAGQVLGTAQTQKVGLEGNYTVNVYNSDGCEELGKVQVRASSPPVFSIAPDFYFCEGESVRIDAPLGFALYEWFHENDQKQAEGTSWQTAQIGNFYLKISNELGCFASKNFTIHSKPIPEVVIIGEPFLCEKSPEITLTAEAQSSLEGDSLSYEWKKEDVFLSETPEIAVDEIGNYAVTVRNSTGCSTTKTVSVINCCEPVLKIPNAFTPFSTPDNNEYRIAHQDILTFNMKIYNRWGTLIFETDNADGFWDGTFKGKPLQPSVYQLVIEYTGCRNGITFQEKKTEAIYLLD